VVGVTAPALVVASRVQIWATLSQLDFLRRSGRVPAVAAIGAGALRLQPIVRYSGGSPTPVGVTRNAQRGVERLWRAWQRSASGSGSLHVVSFHCERADDARDLRARIVEREPTADIAVVEVMASLASHTGPGLLGLAWLWGP
jgi:fatty acid-binding protein DegV